MPVIPSTPLVLVAEDYELAGLLIERYLTRGDAAGRVYTVERVENGRQAVEAATSKRYDLILMDVDMPEMDGVEATRMIRADEARRSASGVPIIAITANDDPDARERYLGVGFSDYLAKPVTRNLLHETVARATRLTV